MNKIFLPFIVAFFTNFLCAESSIASTRIALVLPAEHKALRMIEKGFKKEWKGEEEVVVFNALGEASNVTSILDTIAGAPGFAAIATIGNTLTQQAAKYFLLRKVPLLGAAANITASSVNNPQLCCVVDEVPAKNILLAIKKVAPLVSKVTLVVANDEKMLQEIPFFEEDAGSLGIDVQVITVDSLQDMTNKVTPSSIDKDSTAIVILKDHLTVSQIPQLLKVVNALGILLVSADQGSVLEGAHFGVGVSEYQTGVVSAQVLYDILRETKVPSEVGCQMMQQFSTFVDNNWLNSMHTGSAPKLRFEINLNGLSDASPVQPV